MPLTVRVHSLVWIPARKIHAMENRGPHSTMAKYILILTGCHENHIDGLLQQHVPVETKIYDDF